MGNKVRLLLLLVLLTGIGVWSARHFRFFNKGTVAASTTIPASSPASVATVSSIASSTSVALPTAPPTPTSTSAWDTEPNSTFIAQRYDATHVAFRVSNEFQLSEDDQKLLHDLHSEALPLEPDAKIWDSIRQNFEQAHVGEHWQLEISAASRTPVTIQKPVVFKWECDNETYAAGFIAEVAPSGKDKFAAASQKYFMVHKLSAAPAQEPSSEESRVSALPDWKSTPEVRSQIESAIIAGLKGEIAHERDRGTYGGLPRQLEEDAASGRVKLDYEIHAFQLSPDGVPRLFVHARWMVAQQRALLMNIWLRVGNQVTSEPLDERATAASWISAQDGEFPADQDVGFKALGTVVNVVDRADGYGDLLIDFEGYEGYSVILFRYTDASLVATAISQGDGC